MTKATYSALKKRLAMIAGNEATAEFWEEYAALARAILEAKVNGELTKEEHAELMQIWATA